MKGKYKNLQSETVEILQHDEANKIVYIQNSEGEKKWIAAEECKWWQRLDKKEEPVYVPEKTIEVPLVEERKVEEPEVEIMIMEEKPVEKIIPKQVHQKQSNKKK